MLSSGAPESARNADPRCALTAKRNSGGVARSQPAIADGVGRRRKVALSSSAGRRSAYARRKPEGFVPAG